MTGQTLATLVCLVIGVVALTLVTVADATIMNAVGVNDVTLVIQVRALTSTHACALGLGPPQPHSRQHSQTTRKVLSGPCVDAPTYVFEVDWPISSRRL